MEYHRRAHGYTPSDLGFDKSKVRDEKAKIPEGAREGRKKKKRAMG